jgi:hypothetical protein
MILAALQLINKQHASSDRPSTDAVTTHRNGSTHSGFSAKEAVQKSFRKPSLAGFSLLQYDKGWIEKEVQKKNATAKDL